MVRRFLLAAVLGLGAGAIVVALTRSEAPVDVSAPPSPLPAADAAVVPTTTAAPTLGAPPENLGPRKDLVDLDGWLNTDIDSLDDLDGTVVLVEMWTFGCSNCKARIPHTQELYATYADRGFEIVGVHAPEFDYEAQLENIVDAVDRLGVSWPVALDTSKRNFRAWQEGGRRFWPRTFVIDQSGNVRFDHIGEGAYEELEATVAWLLGNPPTS